MEDNTSKPGGIVVISGGTAANFLVDVFNLIIQKRSCPLSYVIPISDNGGSSSELIRVFGGPSVGDIRSRLVRLIPSQTDNGDEENTALRALFEHRLSADPTQAKAEWLEIVEGSHLLWSFVSSPKRELIRSVLNTLNLEIVKRSRPTSLFNFSKASVGNMFLTGARIFSGSFEAAIYLLSIICRIPTSISVLPSINSNFTHHIAASLEDGTTLTGQVAISHPSEPTAVPDAGGASGVGTAFGGGAAAAAIAAEDATLPGSLSALRSPNISFSKDDEEDLPARIGRVWYINPYGHEIWPVANPKALAALRACDTVVYSIGSLYTSIIPNLILRGVGAAIAGDAAGGGRDGGSGEVAVTTTAARRKVLILNATVDRETGPRSDPMDAVDFVKALACAAASSLQAAVMSTADVADDEIRRYVTHLVYLDRGEGGGHQQHLKAGGDGPRVELAPVVDEAALAALGISCLKVRGRLVRTGGGSGAAVPRYDEDELAAALEAIMDSAL
ncbi:hypothetical protein RB597_003952 [Gaeumannomyces tritici]